MSSVDASWCRCQLILLGASWYAIGTLVLLGVFRPFQFWGRCLEARQLYQPFQVYVMRIQSPIYLYQVSAELLKRLQVVNGSDQVIKTLV